MASSGGTTAPLTTVRVLCSFFLTPESGKVDSQPIHKEKFNLPICQDKHKSLHDFKTHLEKFTDINQIAKNKGLDGNPEINIARMKKVPGGVEAFSLRTQDAWEHELPVITADGNAMLQGK